MQTDRYQNDLIAKLQFTPKENSISIYQKKYSNHDNYKIEIDLDKNSIDFGNEIFFNNSKKSMQNITKQENLVVLECVDRLLEKGYNPKNIILEKRWPTGHQHSAALDILINNDDSSAYMMIECKTWGKEFEKALNKLHKDGGQLFTYFQQDKDAEVLVLYASQFINNEIQYINQIVKIEEEYKSTSNVKDFFDRWNKTPKNNGIFDRWTTPYNYKSKALTPKELTEITSEDSSKIFNRFMEILRHNVVSDKPNAFSKIFTLFLCKIMDEKATKPNEELGFQWLEGIDTHISFQKRLTDLYQKGMKEFLDKEVSDLSDAKFEEKFGNLDNSVKEELLEEFTKIRLQKNNEFAIKDVFDQETFEDNAIVVKEVVELLQNYQIRYTKKQQFLSDFFELLLTTGLKQEVGQFFTPVPIAKFIIRSIPFDKIIQEKLSQGVKGELLPNVIDYAVGSGHFITEAMDEIQKYINNTNKDDYISDTARKLDSWKIDHFDWAYDYVYGIEKDYRLVKTAKVGCYLHGDGLAKVIHGDGLANFTQTKEYKGKLTKRDSDYYQDNKQFDMVISNPPYSVSAFKNISKKFNKDDFELYEKLTDQSSEIEALFIERTKQLLKDGGIAGVILPSSILSNGGIYTKTREIIFKYFDIVSITELGSNTFMATGTNTVILFLRRKNNMLHVNIKMSVDKLFESKKDITINGIEKPLLKYIKHVWEDIGIEDYFSLLNDSPSDKLKVHELYQEYDKKIGNTEKIIELEKEKLFYFVMAYTQKVTVVKTGEKKEEKRFLGYEFSNRRGSEGIHPIQRGKTIDECTSLYDENSYENSLKANSYIYSAFDGEFKKIDENLKDNIFYVDLVDMMSFDRVDFEKNISLNVKKKVKIESKWEVKSLNTCKEIEFINGYAFKSSDFKDINTSTEDLKVLKIGNIIQEYKKVLFKKNFQYHNSSNYLSKIVNENDLVIALTGATVGKAGWVSEKCLLNQRVLALRGNLNFLKYIASFLFNDVFYSYAQTIAHGNAQGNISPANVGDFKIPIPPKDIQERIVKDIEIIEITEQKTNEYIKALNENVSQLVDNCTSSKETKLENLSSMIKRGKSAKYGTSSTQIIKSGQARGYKKFDFTDKHFVDKKFILDERELQKGDILINSSGVGTAGRVTLFDLDGVFVVDSHVSILRADTKVALPDFILYSLANIGFKTIEAMATGQSGQIELSLTIIKNIKISLPSLKEQKVIVSKIEKLEKEIQIKEEELANIPKQKEAILEKYLK